MVGNCSNPVGFIREQAQNNSWLWQEWNTTFNESIKHWNSINNNTSSGCRTNNDGFAIVDGRLWTLFVVIGALGVLGNASVAFVLLRFTNMRRRLTNIYVINQSVIDSVASLFLLLTTVFQDQTVSDGLTGELKCRIWITKVKK
jgi:hypothetical protein